MKILLICFGILCAAMLFAPEIYAIVYLNLIGRYDIPTDSYDMIIQRIAISIYAPTLVVQHLPYCIGGFIMSLVFYLGSRRGLDD